jgi:hypothetical protein
VLLLLLLPVFGEQTAWILEVMAWPNRHLIIFGLL